MSPKKIDLPPISPCATDKHGEVVRGIESQGFYPDLCSIPPSTVESLGQRPLATTPASAFAFCPQTRHADHFQFFRLLRISQVRPP